MIERLKTSWELVKASAAVLQKDKELLIFPILSGIGLVLLTLVFILPFFFGDVLDTFFSSRLGIFSYVVLFLFYLLQYTIVFFSNTALVGAAQIRLRGGDPTVSDGFRIALSRLPAILGYALIAATVGLILKALSRNKNNLGRMVASLLGLAWNVATFLVVPILAAENVGPIQAIKNSANLLKRTWGEQVIGNFGLGAFFNLIYFVLILGGVALAAAAASLFQSWIPAAIVIVLLVLLFALTALVNSTLSGIYTAAVYEYAATGRSTGFFDPGVVQNAFRPANV